MKNFLSILSLFCISCTSGQAQPDNIPSAEIQIAGAVMAAPEEMRSGARVLGYDPNGNFVELRTGTNEMVCVADDPNIEGFNVACYHKDLEPFMARGRELREQGKSFKEIFDAREEEVKSGKLCSRHN